MITHIHVKNFKSWRDSGGVKLAPLTGFFGTNSSGKSSLLQMLLLLKQTAEHSDSNEVIFFGDENSLVNLGNFREVIHEHEEQKLLKLGLGCKLQDPFTAKFPRVNSYNHFTDFQMEVDSFSFEVAIEAINGIPMVEHICYNVGSDEDLRMKWKDGYLSYGQFNERASGIKSFYHLSGSRRDNLLQHLASSFKTLFSHVYYLGPTRVHPQRLYHWEKTHPKEIDLWGNEAVDALLSARVRQLTTAYNGESVSIEKRISKWLQKLNLADSFWLGAIGNLSDNNYEVRIQKSPKSAKVTLADMGHGVADLFPLLVHCCYVPEGSILILEQPGVHLHPQAQAELADLLIEVITERNLQILIESHSEHLLTRLQLHIAEQKIAASDTALYFCENENGVSTIKSLDVDELGNITNWPPNFFGNVRGDLVKMTRKQMKRRKETEGE